jgi:hypothetical protein
MQATHQPPTTDTSAARTSPAELLRGAARYLRRHGWTQGEFFDLLTEQPFPPACTLGAISIAASGRCLADPFTTLDDPASDDAIRAARILAAYLDPDADPWTSAIDIIGDWNDHDTRTLDDVIDALHTAADEYVVLPAGGAR